MFTFAEKLKQMSNIEHKDVGVSSLKGTPSRKIYIKTSTEAVYNPEGVSQEYINNHVDGSKIVDGTVTTSKIANGAVSMNKLDTAVKTLIQQGASSSWTPKGTYSVTTEYDANDAVYDETTNSSYLSLKADNIGHAVTDTEWWMLIMDGSDVNTLVAELQAGVEAAIAAAQEDLAEATQAANEAASAANAKIDWVTEQVNDLTAYEVATALDETSIIPVQNKVVTEAFKSVQMPDIDEYSSTLSVPSKAMFRIILPFNFVIGETYDIEVSTANALTSSIRFYVYQSGQYSNNTTKYLGEIPAGGTTAKTTYTPVSETNYQFFGLWNNNNAATSVDVTITKKQKAINNIVSNIQDTVVPLQLEEFFNDCLPNLKVLDYEIYNTENLSIHDCVVDANHNWYKTAASQGQNAKHIVVPVIDGSIVIMRGKYDVMQFWLNSSYDPNTTYSSGSAPVVGSRQFISGTKAVLYTPTNAAYFAISIVFGDYNKSLMPDEIIVITNYINKSAEPPYITTDFEVGCTNEANLKCVKSEDNIYTFVCYNNVRYNYAYIKIPVAVGHKYKLCFNAAARTKLNTVWNGLMVLKKNNPEDQIDDRNYKAVVLGKTNQEYFEWDFVAEYPVAYMRVKASDLGNPNYGNATIVVMNIKLIDMGKTDMDAVTSILMDGEISAINSILDNAAIIDIVDGGLYVCDRYLNVGGYLDINGIHANNLNS